MDFLKEILGEDLFPQFKEKVDNYNNEHKDKPLKLVNLSEGNYISKEKFDSKETEATNLKKQVEDANKEIQSYKDMDIDSIKQSASDWETKYNELVESQKVEKEKSIRKERTDAFFSDVKFASEMAKTGVIAKFNEKDFKYDEESKSFQGAKEWLEELKKSDANSFMSDVVNPSFSTTPTAPTNDSSMDSILEAMGLDETKK